MITEPVYKQPYEQFGYSLDFVDRLPTGVNLASCTVSAYDLTTEATDNSFLSSTTATVSTTVALAGINGGTAGHDYKVTFKAIASDSMPTMVEEEVLFRVRET